MQLKDIKVKDIVNERLVFTIKGSQKVTNVIDNLEDLLHDVLNFGKIDVEDLVEIDENFKENLVDFLVYITDDSIETTDGETIKQYVIDFVNDL